MLLGAPPVLAAASSGGVSDPPMPDVNYEYNQLYFMSSSYLQRYSGDDGPPGDLNPADGNLPPDVNGWQEFFAHWKQQVTAPSVMGGFAPDLHVDDHPFRAPTAWFVGPPPPNDSDVATVTIPGSVCPGQTVLIASHPDSTPLLNDGNGSSYDDTSGVTMGMAELQAMTRWWSKHHTWPTRTFRVALFDAEETGLYGSQYYADHLIPPGPQGKIVLVANMDQNGMEYPAHPAGSQQTTFGPGFWYTNINASPVHDFSVYGGGVGHAPPQFARNMPAIKHFRAALADAVAETFARLGHAYHYRVPLENPLDGGRTVPAYTQSDIHTYSPVQDDTLGRTDQVPFVQRGIPGYGIVGAYDSNANDNPLAGPATPLTPLGAAGIPLLAGYDTPRDNMTHLNLMTSGTTGGVAGVTGSVELKRALELPMAWTLDLVSRPEYAGGSPAPTGPVAYFEALPTTPAAGTPVTFNGAMSAANGRHALSYHWRFGDGTSATGAVVKHAYAEKGWYDAELVVRRADGRLSGYLQTVRVGNPSGPRPKTDPCGRMTPAEVRSTLAATPSAAGAASSGSAASGSRLPRTGGAPWWPTLGLLALAVAAMVARRVRWPRR
jgi:hypothetical protein